MTRPRKGGPAGIQATAGLTLPTDWAQARETKEDMMDIGIGKAIEVIGAGQAETMVRTETGRECEGVPATLMGRMEF